MPTTVPSRPHPGPDPEPAAPVRGSAPSTPRLLAAGAVAAALSLIAVSLLFAGARAAFDVPAGFQPFDVASYAGLTVVGIAGATACWAVVTRRSTRPVQTLRRLAVAVSAVLLLPDVALLVTRFEPFTTTAGVLALMAAHLVIAVVAYVALTRIAPAVPVRRS